MADYTVFIPLVAQMPRRSANWHPIVERLKQIWSREHLANSPNGHIVDTDRESWGHLFDTASQRLVAAWGVSGRASRSVPADSPRTSSQPVAVGPQYHRLLALAQSMVGNADVNLVPLIGRMGIGAVGALERMALDHPGSLYFTHWLFDPARPDSLSPAAVEQGFMAPGYRPDVRRYPN